MARRARAPKKPKDPKIEPERLPLVEKAIHELIAEYQIGNLERITIVARSKAGKASGPPCGRIVKVSIVSKAVNALLKDEEIGAVQYAVDVKVHAWDKLDADEKKRELLHAVCHMGGYDDHDRLFLVQHEIEEFQRVVDVFGAYAPSITKFAKAAKQLPLAGTEKK